MPQPCKSTCRGQLLGHVWPLLGGQTAQLAQRPLCAVIVFENGRPLHEAEGDGRVVFGFGQAIFCFKLCAFVYIIIMCALESEVETCHADIVVPSLDMDVTEVDRRHPWCCREAPLGRASALTSPRGAQVRRAVEGLHVVQLLPRRGRGWHGPTETSGLGSLSWVT